MKIQSTYQQYRNLYIKHINRKDLLNIKKIKKYCKRHNEVFEKIKIRLIDKVEYREHSCLIQVSFQDKVRAATIKENSSKFKLAYNSPLLEEDLVSNLGLSGKGKLPEEVLSNKIV